MSPAPPLRRVAGVREALSRRPVTASAIAIAIRAVTLLIIVEIAGVRTIGRPLSHLHPAWIAVVAATQLLIYPAYVIAYRSVARLGSPNRMATSTVARIVIAGFGPLAAFGGFGIDRDAFGSLENDDALTRTRVGAMATIEWAVLAPATCLASVALLTRGSDVAASLLWPWALGLPVLVGAAVWATAPGRPEKLARPRGRRVDLIARALAGLSAVRTMAQHPHRYAGAWAGTCVYWAAEICALYAALRSVGLDLAAETAILAYATGYLASRRSLPLGGAGLTEALLVYSLYQLHEPIGPAVDAVIIYRAFNFLVVLVPALVAYRGLNATRETPAQLATE